MTLEIVMESDRMRYAKKTAQERRHSEEENASVVMANLGRLETCRWWDGEYDRVTRKGSKISEAKRKGNVPERALTQVDS